MPRQYPQSQTTDREGGKSQQAHSKGHSLAKQPSFEELINRISSTLIAATGDQVDPAIEQSIEEIRHFFEADWCGLVQVLPAKECLRITHASSADHVPRGPVHFDLSRDFFPWCYHQLVEQQEFVSVETLDDFPAEAGIDRQTHRDWSIRSLLEVPLIADGRVVHIIALHAVRQERAWPEEFIQRLSLLGEVLVSVVERRKM